MKMPIYMQIYLLLDHCRHIYTCGWRSWSRCCGSTILIAERISTSPSFAMSTAIFTAPLPVRFPERHCNIHNLFSWTVNSMSCIYQKMPHPSMLLNYNRNHIIVKCCQDMTDLYLGFENMKTIIISEIKEVMKVILTIKIIFLRNENF